MSEQQCWPNFFLVDLKQSSIPSLKLKSFICRHKFSWRPLKCRPQQLHPSSCYDGLKSQSELKVISLQVSTQIWEWLFKAKHAVNVVQRFLFLIFKKEEKNYWGWRLWGWFYIICNERKYLFFLGKYWMKKSISSA